MASYRVTNLCVLRISPRANVIRGSSGQSRHQDDRVAADGLTAANMADVFASFGFDIHAFGRPLQEAGQIVPNGRFDRPQFGFLGENGDVGIDRLPAPALELRQGFAEETLRGHVFPLRVRIGVSVANVAQTHRAQQGIGEGMQDDIGIRMANQSARMGNADAAEDQRPSFGQAVGVVTTSDADFHKFLTHSGAMTIRRTQQLYRGVTPWHNADRREASGEPPSEMEMKKMWEFCQDSPVLFVG